MKSTDPQADLKQALRQAFEAPADLAHQLARHFHIQDLAKGETWARQGERLQKLAWQAEGYIRVSAVTDGKEITQWISMPGYWLTDLGSFYRQQPSRWTLTALAPTRLLVLGKDTCTALESQHPEWLGLQRNFLVKCFELMENRIFGYLSQSAEERFEALFAFAPQLFNEVPLQYLASMLGMSPETLSRLRNRVR